MTEHDQLLEWLSRSFEWLMEINAEYITSPHTPDDEKRLRHRHREWEADRQKLISEYRRLMLHPQE